MGACGAAVVKVFMKFSVEKKFVAEAGCGAVANLTYKNDSNKKELGRVGAKDVVRACEENDYKTFAPCFL